MSNSELQFEFNEPIGRLYALYSIDDGQTPTPINKQALLQKLKSDGYGELQPLPKGIEEVISNHAKPVIGEGRVCIAERRDAEVMLHISSDKMGAYLTIIAPAGGKPATLEMVKKVLAEKGVRCGFLPKAVKKAILLGEADEIQIAKGDPIINGDDAKFICLIKDMKLRTPKVAEDGHVDYRDLGEIQVVHPDDELMRRVPATQGIASKNIFGEVINPKPGKDLKFASGLEGVKTSPKDFNTLIATVTGQPVICKNGINVEKTLTIASVDLKSGNVVFDGSLVIEGDVAPGMKVKASGDILIKGMVENATIEAGGDINIKGAVIGRSDSGTPASESLVKIEAKNSVSAKFAENATIISGDKIMIQDWVIKSELNALNEVVVGKKNAQKGQIIGGNITSGILVQAMNIGSNAGVSTHIKVGSAGDIEEEKQKVSFRISQVMKEITALKKAFKELKNNPTSQAKEALKKTLVSKQAQENDLFELRVIEADIEKKRKRANNAKVIAGKMIYSGTSIKISKYSEDIQTDTGARCFSVQGDKIVQTAR